MLNHGTGKDIAVLLTVLSLVVFSGCGEESNDGVFDGPDGDAIFDDPLYPNDPTYTNQPPNSGGAKPTQDANIDSPRIDGARCDPKNGEDGVNHLVYNKITIAFNTSLMEANVISTNPVFPFNESLVQGGTVLTLNFLNGYKLGPEMSVTVDVNTRDRTGNTATLSYSFTTMILEE